MQSIRNLTRRAFNTGKYAINTGRKMSKRISTFGMSAVRGASSAASSLASTLRSMTPPVAPFLAKMHGSETFFIDGIAELFNKMPASKYGQAHLVANAIMGLFQKNGKPIPANLQAAFKNCLEAPINAEDRVAVTSAGLAVSTFVDGASAVALADVFDPIKEEVSGGGVTDITDTILITGQNIIILPFLFAFYTLLIILLGVAIVTSGAYQSYFVLKDKIFGQSSSDSSRTNGKSADFDNQILMASGMYELMMENVKLVEVLAKGDHVIQGGSKKRRARKHVRKSNKKIR